ncbi:hypothetical protein D3C73_1597090 [compost metagenome]
MLSIPRCFLKRKSCLWRIMPELPRPRSAAAAKLINWSGNANGSLSWTGASGTGRPVNRRKRPSVRTAVYAIS